MRLTSSIALTILVSLAACASNDNTPEPLPPAEGPFKGLIKEQTELLTKYHDAALTKPADMPQTGTASYEGVIGFGQRTITTEIMDGEKVIRARRNKQIADIHLDADFTNSSISGNVTNFRNKHDNSLPGSLAISGGVIENSGFKSAQVTGNVAFDGINRANVTGFANGNFVGSKAQGIDGSMLVFKETTTGGTESVNGSFVAEKQ